MIIPDEVRTTGKRGQDSEREAAEKFFLQISKTLIQEDNGGVI